MGQWCQDYLTCVHDVKKEIRVNIYRSIQNKGVETQLHELQIATWELHVCSVPIPRNDED